MFAVAAMFFAFATGCGGASRPIDGSVRFEDGSPVTSGSIEFRNVKDKQRFVSRIATDGSFQPTDRNGELGLPPGSYDVVVVQIVLTEDLALEDHSHGNTVPRRYADYYTSDIKVDIAPGQTQSVEIVIQQE